jgi:hypothetical protein
LSGDTARREQSFANNRGNYWGPLPEVCAVFEDQSEEEILSEVRHGKIEVRGFGLDWKQQRALGRCPGVAEEMAQARMLGIGRRGSGGPGETCGCGPGLIPALGPSCCRRNDASWTWLEPHPRQ